MDWGTRRIGLAISDPDQVLAHPLATLTRRAGRRFPLKSLRPHLEAHRPVGVVVGLPLEADGSEGRSAGAARETATLLANRTALPVTLWDERMTTARTRRDMAATGARPRPRQPVDHLAAAVLLQTYLDARRSRR